MNRNRNLEKDLKNGNHQTIGAYRFKIIREGTKKMKLTFKMQRAI